MRTAAPAKSAALNRAPSDLAWRVLGLVNLYRLLVSASLFAASRFSDSSDVLNILQPGDMAVICSLWFFAGIGLIALRRLPLAGLRSLTLAHAIVDSVAMGFVLWASGGIAGGLGILLLLPVAAMALLARKRD